MKNLGSILIRLGLSINLCYSLSIEPSAHLGRRETPDGCTVLSSDSSFPPPDVWQSSLPGVVARKIAFSDFQRPDYRFSPKTVKEVEKAVQFAKEHSIRLTIINTGHDYLGRNDAPSGLSLDVSQLRGVRLDPSFTPTTEGVEMQPGIPVQRIDVAEGQTPAVTFGVGIVGSELNNAIASQGLFVVSGGAPTVAPGGGWGQSGGHSFVSHLYGLGVDQFLEFKVVTADGKLKIANKVSNPDLFWALRGGGDGSWGVVTQATVKAYKSPKALLQLVSINSSTASLASYSHLNDGADAAGLYDAVAYLGSQHPDMVDRGAGGIFVTTPNSFVGGALFFGENATAAYAQEIWGPVLEKMSTFPGMQKAQTTVTAFETYQEFFNYLWPKTGKNGNAAGTEGTGPRVERRHGFTKRASERYGGLFGKLVEAGFASDEELEQVWSYLRKLQPRGQTAVNKRDPQSIPSVDAWNQYTPNGDYNLPTSHGLLPMDNRLLARSHLEALPSSSMEIRRWWASRYIMEIVAGPKTHEPKDDDVSVVPAWRKAYISCYTPYFPPISWAEPLRELAPDSGAYINEAYYGASDWKEAFWGSNYDRLSQVKAKYDPENLFWVTPGVNADKMEVRDGRVCKPSPGYADRLGNAAPVGDNVNAVNLVANVGDLLGVIVPYRGQSANATDV